MSNWFAWPPWGRQKGRQRSGSTPSRTSSRTSSRTPSDGNRTRSSPRSFKRRSRRHLTQAEKAERTRQDKRAKEMEEQKVESMSVADRIAYKEEKELKHQEAIRKLKADFAKAKAVVGEQYQSILAETNRAWKRKHDDDSAAQAAERKQAFLDARARREREFLASPPERANVERDVYKNHAVELFEKIYMDLQHHFLHPTMINSETYDPYQETFTDPGHVRFQRFRQLSSNPEDGTGGVGVDSAAVLMLSETFRIALRYGEDPNGFQEQRVESPLAKSWEEFEIMLRLEHASIRGFAIARHIPYMMVYRRTGQKLIGGDAHVADESLQLSPSLRDPFEVYLTSDGRLLPCLYTPLAGNVESGNQSPVPVRFHNMRESIYNKANFKDYAPPSSWPPTWEYPPVDIQHPCREWGKNYPLCVVCGHRTGPPEAPEEPEGPGTVERKETCQCKTIDIFNKVLVEMREYQSSTTSKQLLRGIRSLQKLHKGHIIGEILGEFIPLGAETDFNSPSISTFDFNGPPAVDQDGKVLEIDPHSIRQKRIDTNTDPIATLITGHKSGWTRLINSGTSRTANVEARSEVWAGKLRITVRALRDINFGEQLLIRHGDVFLEADGQSLSARRKNHTERLPMRSLSGFFK